MPIGRLLTSWWHSLTHEVSWLTNESSSRKVAKCSERQKSCWSEIKRIREEGAPGKPLLVLMRPAPNEAAVNRKAGGTAAYMYRRAINMPFSIHRIRSVPSIGNSIKIVLFPKNLSSPFKQKQGRSSCNQLLYM